MYSPVSSTALNQLPSLDFRSLILEKEKARADFVSDFEIHHKRMALESAADRLKTTFNTIIEIFEQSYPVIPSEEKPNSSFLHFTFRDCKNGIWFKTSYKPSTDFDKWKVAFEKLESHAEAYPTELMMRIAELTKKEFDKLLLGYIESDSKHQPLKFKSSILKENIISLEVTYWFDLPTPIKNGVHIQEIKKASLQDSKVEDIPDDWKDF